MLRFFLVVLILGVSGSMSHAIVLEDLIKKNLLEKTLLNKKVGYYLGSFDPLHLGHEKVVKKALESNLCDYVLIYPAWGGDGYKNRTDLRIRLEMLFATFADNPRVIVTKLNPGQLQEALTEDTDVLIEEKPTVKSKIKGARYIGLIGSDAALDTNKDVKKRSVFMRGIKVPDKYKEHTAGGVIAIPVEGFIVNVRANESIQELKGKLGEFPILKVMETDLGNRSSTIVRAAVKKGEDIYQLVNPCVKEIISRENLYK